MPMLILLTIPELTICFHDLIRILLLVVAPTLSSPGWSAGLRDNNVDTIESGEESIDQSGASIQVT